MFPFLTEHDVAYDHLAVTIGIYNKLTNLTFLWYEASIG